MTWLAIGRTLGVASVRAAAIAPSVSATPRALVSVLGSCPSALRSSYIQAAVAQGYVVRRSYAAAAASARKPAAKKPAAKKTTGRKPAAKKTAARKPAAKKKATAKKATTKKATAKKAPKLTAAKKRAAMAKKRAAMAKKRAAAAKKRAAAAKKKKAAATKKKARKAKKESPEKRERRRRILLLHNLRQYALIEQPKNLADHPYLIYLQEMREASPNKSMSVIDAAKEAGKLYKQLPETDKNRLRGIAAANAAANALAYKRWVESHPPTAILKANKARNILKRRFPGRFRKSAQGTIKDARIPTRPRSAWVQYIMSRHQNGTAPETKKEDMGARFKILAVDWKALSSTQKKPFEDLAAAEKVKYQAFTKDVKL